MDSSVDIVLRHGYAALFLWLLLSQLGVPLPAAPLLIAAGALTAVHRLDVGTAIAVAMLACLAADSFLFAMGRAHGARIVRAICRISLESMACVRATEAATRRFGGWLPVVGRFVPGLGLVSAPMAGQSSVRYVRFAAFDGAGALLWAFVYIGLGRLLGARLGGGLEIVHVAGHGMALVVLALAVFVAVRIGRRWLARRRETTVSITVAELQVRLAGANPPVLVDLRPVFEGKAAGASLPGARRMTADEVVAAADAITRTGELVLFCDCVDDAASRHLAGRLRRLGFERVFPLEGGFGAWLRAGYPLAETDASPAPTDTTRRPPGIDPRAGTRAA